MCSIEEAWAGQNFEGLKVQSQADLHRKYMPFADDLLERNNEFSIGRNEPQSREGTRGINSKMSREPRVPNMLKNEPNAQINYSSTLPTGSYYGGLEPRPSYMSIYNNTENIPMPSIVGKENFNDINQAYNVSDTINHFMNRGLPEMNKNNLNNNNLLNEDNEMDKLILKKKLNNLNINNESFNNNNMQQSSEQNLEFQKTLQDMIYRLDKLERDMHQNNSRNMYDMVLYILVGMLISFIIYSILRK